MGEPQFPVKINLPISEKFANFLFQGRDHTQNVDGINMLRFKWDLKFEILGNERQLSLEELFHKITDDCQREHGDRNICGYIYPMDIFFYIVSGRTNVIVGRFYGIWNDLGPQLVIDLIERAKNDKSVMNFIISIGKTMKEYDGIFSGERRNIGSRIRNAEKTRQELKNLNSLLDPGPKRRALPENVIKYIAKYVGEPVSKRNLPSAALARLLSNKNKNNKTKKHGGAIRNQTRRRKH